MPTEIFKKIATTSVPIINIKDIKEVKRVREGKFTIQCMYNGNNKVFNYEAKRAGDASEIIARLNYLIVYSYNNHRNLIRKNLDILSYCFIYFIRDSLHFITQFL